MPNYFSTIPNDIEKLLITFLDPYDVLKLALCNKHLRKALLYHNQEYWQEQCEELWSNKIYVPLKYRQNSCKYASYFESILDSERIEFDSIQELCSLHFHFRFKRGAGEFWCLLDPSHNGLQPPMYRKFEPNGSFSKFPPSSSPSSFSLNKNSGMPFSNFCVGRSNGEDPLDVVELPKIRWRFTKSRKGLEKGQFIKLNNWPSLYIRRTSDWGWSLSNEWTYYRTCCDSTYNLDVDWMFDDDEEYHDLYTFS